MLLRHLSSIINTCQFTVSNLLSVSAVGAPCSGHENNSFSSVPRDDWLLTRTPERPALSALAVETNGAG